MDSVLLPVLAALAICGGMLAALSVGRRLRAREQHRGFDSTSTGVLDGGVLALLGLLIAFTFSSAASRLDYRRQLGVQESNDIGTAWLRLDLLPEAPRAELQQLFREYVDARLEFYRRLPDLQAADSAFARGSELQGRIWSRARESAAVLPSPGPSLLLLPALNTMFDTASARRAAILTHQPGLIFGMLVALALCAAVLVGHATPQESHGRLLHTWAFALIVSLTIYVILDLEFPSIGLIRLDLAEQLLEGVRAGMK